MLRLSCVGLLVSALACSSAGNGDGSTISLTPSQSMERIVGGATFTGLPGVGSLTAPNYNIDGKNFCTGTLISSRRVVTAAHCLDEIAPTQLVFAIGPDATAPTKTYKVASGAQYPPQYDSKGNQIGGWNPQTLTGDIAYVDLASDATETPLKVLSGMDATWENLDLTFVGYGVEDGQGQRGNGVKRAVVMPIYQMGATQFSYETTGKNTCNGDSGGPAFFIDNAGNYLLAGTTSYGDTVCTVYGVDTIVEPYAKWLGVTPVKPAAYTSPGTGGGGDTGGGDTGGGGTGGDTGGGGTTDPGTTSGCGNETFVGRFDGNTVHWCENDTQYYVDCTTRNKVCVYSKPDGYFGCADRDPATTDPCNGETYQGRCDGKTVIWCEDNQVQQLACGDYNGWCGVDPSRLVYNCIYK